MSISREISESTIPVLSSTFYPTSIPEFYNILEVHPVCSIILKVL